MQELATQKEKVGTHSSPSGRSGGGGGCRVGELLGQQQLWCWLPSEVLGELKNVVSAVQQFPAALQWLSALLMTVTCNQLFSRPHVHQGQPTPATIAGAGRVPGMLHVRSECLLVRRMHETKGSHVLLWDEDPLFLHRITFKTCIHLTFKWQKSQMSN